LRMAVYLVVALVVVALATTLAIQNAVTVTFKFFFWEFDSSLALLLLMVFALGIMVALIVTIPTVVSRSRTLSNQKRQIAQLERRLQRSSEIPMARRPEEPPRPP